MKQWEYTSESEVSIAIIITMVNLVKTSKKKILNSNYIHSIDTDSMTHTRSRGHSFCFLWVYSSPAERDKYMKR